MVAVAEVFAANGALAQTLTNFHPRQAQVDMSVAIERTLAAKQSQNFGERVLVVEAETGTGKTFAYLAPALLNPQQTIISTGTKNLQEQLFHRDLPRLRDVLAPQRKVALLKGRSNYLCIHRLDQAVAHSGQLPKALQAELVTVKQWANRTRSGDVGELNVLPEDAQVLPHVTSTLDNCLGRDCPDYDKCYLVNARKEALDADIVVVNHHLFFADMALKDVGFGELIPKADAVIFDEAHQLPDIASQYFGEAVSSRQLHELAQELKLLYLTEVKDLRQLDAVADKLISALRDFRLAFPHDPMRGNWREWSQREPLIDAAERVQEALTMVRDVIKQALGRNDDLDNGYERVISFLDKWAQLQDTQRTGFSFWFETTPRQVTLHQTPLSVADKFGGYVRFSESSWVFTSATLAIGDSFAHFTHQLGLYEAKTMQLASPFAFAEQALLCVPRFLPQPHEPSMQQALLEVIEPLLEANPGGTFLLFTSYRMLNQVAAALRERSDRLILVQGESSKRDLLDQFVTDGEAVLLGTSSFWEGVDIQGQALSCVVIDKLPFASPDDPLLQARVEDAKLRGIDAFGQVQLPQAVIALKQGAGRLIRDHSDNGVLVVCDNRLVTKPYGKIFLRSLPPMRRTRSISAAAEFLRGLATAADVGLGAEHHNQPKMKIEKE